MVVIDGRIEKGLGAVADCVIRSGKVDPGDFVGEYMVSHVIS